VIKRETPLSALGALGTEGRPFVIMATIRLTQAPTHDRPVQKRQKITTVIRTPINIFKAITNEGVPATFVTHRKNMITEFCQILFPNEGLLHRNVIFMKAPPNSGKTGFGQLLFLQLAERASRSVVFLRCNALKENETVAELFQRADGSENETLESYVSQRGTDERVLIIDEAQASYVDTFFWKTTVKNTQGNAYPGLRIVILSSFGSFNEYRIRGRRGTPIVILERDTYSLYSGPDKSGLALRPNELEEMIANWPFKEHTDTIRLLSSNHIGMASAILNYLTEKLHGLPQPAPATSIKRALYNNSLITVVSQNRGMPTLNAIEQLMELYKGELGDTDMRRLREVMNGVASGKDILANEAPTPHTNKVVGLLVEYGFLFEDEERCLRFASNMHVKVWLYSTRTDPVTHLNNVSFERFVTMAISRISATQLCLFNTANHESGARERQIQMELYKSITSLLPRDSYVIPEWRTADNHGFIGILLQFGEKFWFMELLVEGIDAVGHQERFLVEGKYHDILFEGSEYILIDFRRNVAPRLLKDDFMYVCFSEDYRSATIKNNQKSTLVELLD
jgi:hypothetical protein